MEKTIVLAPIMSEKAFGLSQTRNTYAFAVPQGVNKHTIARAVSAQFDVTVLTVNIMNVAGKAKRTVSKKGRAANGRQADTRKAYVTLKTGDSLPIFAAVLEEQQEEAKLTEKVEKAAEKAKKKADKSEKKKGEDK